MTGFENRAGFTISGSKLQLVEVISKAEQFVLQNVDEAYFNEPLEIERDKETKVVSLLQSAFNELIIKNPLKSSSVSFTFPFELFYTMQAPYDNTLLHEDLVEEFKWELSVIYPFIPVKDLIVQYVEIEKNTLTPFNTALVFAIQRRFLQLIHSFCGQNKLKLKFIDNFHTASDRALAASSPFMEKGIVMSLYLTNRFLSVFFFSDSKPVYHKVIPLTDASEIPALIKEELTSKESFKISRNLIDAYYIAGDDLSSSFVQSLKDSVNIDLIHFNPFDKIKPESKLFSSKCYSERANSFSSAAGIAFRLA
jgi:Tfp pilus assembly PilM family ATPase